MTDLYRFYDQSGQLLYVGISLSAAQRASDHKATKSWWPQVATMTVERICDDRNEALKVERTAIVRERLKYNVVHNGKSMKANQIVNYWICQSCGQPADYIQTDVGRIENEFEQLTDWFCNCKSCDEFAHRATHHLYWFKTSEINTVQDHYDWEKHLNRKRWMDWGFWDAMIGDCRIEKVPDQFRVPRGERYPYSEYRSKKRVLDDEHQLSMIALHLKEVAS